ncbi:MAG: pilus assembly protein N-terminal domain-containing protein [Candidatus Omnitrophica bacterium]|nr:pilus assembly protein N-terminal domain-containing protein [Candidatus Omnitrophota bacterium]
MRPWRWPLACLLVAAGPPRLSPVFAQHAPAPLPPAPPAAIRLVPDAAVLEVPYQQTVAVQIPGATRVLSVQPGIVEARLASPGVVELSAASFGRTFLHVWTAEGRLTRTLQVVQPLIERPTLPEQQRAAHERARHLTFEYRNRFRTLRRGPALDETDLHTTTQFDHTLFGHMEAPIGELSGQAAFQRINSSQELASWYAAVTDGDVGPLERFDAVVGDTTAGASDLTLPQSTIRGSLFRYYAVAPYTAEVFHGRRRFGFATGLSTLADVEDDVFLSGARLLDLERPWTWGLAYGAASGEDRVDIQTSQAAEANLWYWPDADFGVGAEVGRNQEEAHGYRLRSLLRRRTLSVDAAYRNLSQRYENLLGRSADQGERGVLLISRFDPLRTWRWRQRADIYRDTLFHNPEEPDALNLDWELGTDLDLTEKTLWSSTYGRQKLLGRLFPSDTTHFLTSLRQRLGAMPLVGQGTVFGEYQFRDLRSVSAPSSDFDSHTVRVGLGAPLTEQLSWQVAQQWTRVEEELSGAVSTPRETTASLNYFHRLKTIPLSLRSGLSASFTAEATSPSSFLADEDRLTWDAGLRYDVSPDCYLFVDSRVLRRQRPADREYEVDLATGVRYLFDTGITWQPSARIFGQVYHDANRDGRPQDGEPGLPRVTVRAGPDRETVTDAAGWFSLGRLRGDRLEIVVDLASVPPGYVPTSPSSLVLEVADPPPMPLGFGLAAQAELRIRVFIDVNDDGSYDAADAPLAGVRVALRDGKAAVTDSAGWAAFRGLEAGTHVATLQLGDLAVGYVPATPLSQERRLAEGETAEAGFPILADRSIGGRVYVDANRDGRYDGEPALPDVPVCLDDRLRVTTQEDGRYLFKGVAGGRHRVAVNCGAPLEGYLPLGATVQQADLPPQPTGLDAIDFRFGERDVLMQDVVADVLRERRRRAARAAAMEEALTGLQRPRERRAPQLHGTRQEVVVDVEAEVR